MTVLSGVHPAMRLMQGWNCARASLDFVADRAFSGTVAHQFGRPTLFLLLPKRHNKSSALRLPPGGPVPRSVARHVCRRQADTLLRERQRDLTSQHTSAMAICVCTSCCGARDWGQRQAYMAPLQGRGRGWPTSSTTWPSSTACPR